MKKFFVVFLAVIMALSMSLTAFAAGAFISSPSNNKAPRIIEFKRGSDACKAEIEITPYAERNTLPAEANAELEAAYAAIKNATDLSALNADLTAVASKLGISAKSLAVSDLFDMDYINCNHETHKNEHGEFTITLGADTIKSFAGLLHYNNGTWELVDGATAEGDTLTFKMKDFSPFAIVVNAETYPVPTGDNALIYICVAIMVASAAAFVVCIKKTRKTVNQ